MTLLGDIYYTGYGVKINYSTAKEWFLKAAEQGHSDAQRMLKSYDKG